MKSMYNVTKKLLKSNFIRLDSPCKITFAVTYACSFLCKTCNIGRNFLADPRKTIKGELTYEEIEKIFGNSKPSWVQITGGEPFMRDMYLVLKSIIKNNDELYAVSTTTNGFATQVIVESVKRILKLKIPRFVVSISVDGFEEEHNKVRGIKGSFKRCIETFNELKKLEDKNFNVFISYTSSPFNMGKIKDFIEIMKSEHRIEPRYIHMNLYHTSSNFYGGNQNQVKIEEYNGRVLEEIKTYRSYKRKNDFKIDFLEERYTRFAEKFVKTGKSPLPCRALNSSCFIDPYGNVFPCLIWDKKLGNLRDYDYNVKNLWQEPEVVKAQKNAEELKCPNCWTPCEAYQTIAGNLRESLIQIS